MNVWSAVILSITGRGGGGGGGVLTFAGEKVGESLTEASMSRGGRSWRSRLESAAGQGCCCDGCDKRHGDVAEDRCRSRLVCLNLTDIRPGLECFEVSLPSGFYLQVLRS